MLFNKKSRHAKGILAEKIAQFYLRCHGFRILHHRLKNSFGEIDVLASKKNVIYIVEIKFRTSTSDAIEAVPTKSLLRSYSAFLHYDASANLKYRQIRLLVLVIANRFPYFPKFIYVDAL